VGMNLISLWTIRFLKKENSSFYFQESAESSNDLAKNQAFKTQKTPTLFLVNHQSKGRGSKGRQWVDSDLMLSFLWHKKRATDLKAQICEDFAKDVQQALENTWSELKIQFKAPNDLLLEDKKLAGLLMEVLSQGHSKAFVLGLGLNVFSSPKNLVASCLKDQIQSLNENSWQSFLSSLIAYWSKRFVTL